MSDRDYIFYKLTPTKDVKLKIYEEALSFVFEDNNKDINNIAISGPYSSGKSSILETYKSKHPNIKWLHISLAHFESSELSSTENNNISNVNVNSSENNNDVSKEKGNSTEKIAILEGKILNQLIHQIEPNNIPGTNFKVKKNVTTKESLLNTVKITSFFILIAYIWFFNSWCNFIWGLEVDWLQNMLFWTTNSSFLLLSGLVSTVILGEAIYSLIKTQRNRNIFRKVNLQGNEIEIFEENDDSYFDKYLNEVLYLFENSKADAIVFEDMDRYNTNQIFEKLREINTLLNYKRNKQSERKQSLTSFFHELFLNNKDNRKPIRFFYLLRDDIFVSKDRTKFFDLIIPIVPIMDGSNSHDQFIEHFKQCDLFDSLDIKFLQGLSLYIDDIRILKNIYNEFIIYHSQIQSTELDCNKLLAIITYKNVFPRDFSDLQLGMGFVHTLFNSKPNFINHSIQKLNSVIRNLEADIRSTKDEVLTDINELDAAFIKLGQYNELTVSDKNESQFDSRTHFIRAIKDNQYQVSYVTHNYNGNRQINENLRNQFEQLNQNAEYMKRKTAIERRSNDSIEKIKAEIQRLQMKILSIQNSHLKEILNILKEDNEQLFDVIYTNKIGNENKFEEVKASPYFPLIKYLTRNGHIDETYPDYMTYFYENSLSRIDKIFLRSVSDQVKKDFTYQLKDPQLVLSRLRIVDFDSIEILNFNLLCYLLKTKASNEIYLNRFLRQLMITRNYEFIGQFLATHNETNLFVESINHVWPEIFSDIDKESNFSDAQKREYAINTLYYSPEDDIKALNGVGKPLSNFISGNPTFLDIPMPNIDKLISGFSLIGVKFTNIDYSASNKELFTAVYENHLYELTFDLISLILEVVYGLAPGSDFNTKNYTLVNSKPEEPLALYIGNDEKFADNIDDYVDIILENCGECITDEEPMVLEILNDLMITEDHKNEYISYLQTVIGNINKVENKELWSLLLQEKRITYTGNNILSYFFSGGNGLDSVLIQFINSFDKELFFDLKNITPNFGQEFFNAIVACNDLTNERYIAILKTLNMYDKEFSKTEVSGEKIICLINLNIIRMSEPVLIFMREHYPDQLISFIIHNIVEYTENIINSNNFSFNEMISVLEENVDDEYKIKLLSFTTEKLSLQGKTYSNTIKKHVLNNNLDENDIPFILSYYSEETTDIKSVIKDISIKHITNIMNNRYSVHFDLLLELLVTDEIDHEVKTQLFIQHLPDLKKEQAKKCLPLLQMNDFLDLFIGRRPKFEINDINGQILSIFKEKQWITNYYVDDKGETKFYRAIGKNDAEKMAIHKL